MRNRIVNPPSWVITRKSDGDVVMETFSKSVASKINTDKYDVTPIYQYLTELNKKVKSASNDTEHLLSTSANAERLSKSVGNVKSGNVNTHDLIK